MKKHILIITAIAALLCGFLACAGVVSAEDETYTITVNGGYATEFFEADSNQIASAKPGDYVCIRAELKQGVYVTGFSSAEVGEIKCFYDDSGLLVGGFEMPAKNVTVNAVTAEQTPLTIDLSQGGAMLPECKKNIGEYGTPVAAWICQSVGVKVGYYSYDIDVNNDGRNDIHFEGKDGWYFPSSYEAVLLEGAGGLGTVTYRGANSGPYWPITIQFGEEEVKSSYKITVQDGYLRKYDPDTGKNLTGSEMELKPGENVYIYAKKEEGFYVTGWSADGGETAEPRIKHEYQNSWYFTMPAADLNLQPIKEQQKPYVIDLTAGNAKLSDELQTYLTESLPQEGGWIENEYGKLDLNGDKIADCFIENDVVIPLSEGKQYGDFVLRNVNSGPYWPITIRFPDAMPEYAITVTGGHAIDTLGKTVTKASSGEKITIVSDGGPGKYWKSWKSDYDGIPGNFIAFSFTMPARDVTITAETVADQTPYTIDMTEAVGGTDMMIIFNAILANNPSEFESMYADLDSDGTSDITFWDVDGYGAEMLYTVNIRRSENYSLWDSTVIPVKDGPYSPITYTVDINRANSGEGSVLPIKDLRKHSVTVINGSLKLDTETFRAGDEVVVLPELRTDGQYVSGWRFIPDTSVCEWNFDSDTGILSFTMPLMDVKVEGILSKTEPLTIDLSDGKAFLTEKAYHCIMNAIGEKNAGSVDLNGDGITDVYIDMAYNNIRVTEEYSCGTEFTLNIEKQGPYDSITFIRNPKEEVSVTATPEPTEAPTKDRENPRGENKGDSFNPLYLIPVAAALCAVLAAGAIWWRKKKKAAKAGGKEPAVEGPIDTMTDASADTVADSSVESAENDRK
ncbi:MAG: hypothetical protein J6S79_02155 [Lachnospiraceae bacterium]|nr:hypothetical protein [Lachnospiraceae bacterium]